MRELWGSTLYNLQDLPFKIRQVPDTYTHFRKEVEGRSRIRPVIQVTFNLVFNMHFFIFIHWSLNLSVYASFSIKLCVNPFIRFLALSTVWSKKKFIIESVAWTYLLIHFFMLYSFSLYYIYRQLFFCKHVFKIYRKEVTVI